MLLSRQQQMQRSRRGQPVQDVLVRHIIENEQRRLLLPLHRAAGPFRRLAAEVFRLAAERLLHSEKLFPDGGIVRQQTLFVAGVQPVHAAGIVHQMRVTVFQRDLRFAHPSHADQRDGPPVGSQQMRPQRGEEVRPSAKMGVGA